MAAERLNVGAATASRAAVRLDFKKVGHAHVLDLHTTPASRVIVVKAGGTEKLSANTQKIELKRGELVTIREEGNATKMSGPSEAGRESWVLPYRIATLDAQGNPVELQAWVEIDGGGMRPQSAGGFLGRVFAALFDPRHPHALKPIRPSVSMLVTGEVDQVHPRRISLGRTNDFKEVDLRAASPGDMVKVRFVPSFDLQGTEIELPVLRGALHLSLDPPRIQGLGLETAQVTISTTGLPKPDGRAVTLTSDRGRLDKNTLRLDDNGVASTTIRSITTGAATVQAASANLTPAKATVRFAFPWLFLAAALVGGVVGGSIRWALGGFGPVLRVLLLGVLSGFVVACAYSIGINLLPWEPVAHAGEVLVFVLAALGAVVGIPSSSSATG